MIRARHAMPLLAALLLLGYVALAVSAVRDKSNTFDEIAHLTAGYAYWTRNDYRLHPENGNWPQRIGALAAAGSRARFVPADDSGWRRSDAYAVGEQFFFHLGNDVEGMLWRGRAAIALLGAGLGALVFAWSRRLHGPAGGWVALSLYALSPTMLAHGALVTSDMAAALAFLAATGAWWWLLHRPSMPAAAVSSLASAGLFLSKFSAPIVVPIAAGLALLRLARGRPLDVELPGRRVTVTGRPRQALVVAGLGLLHVLAVAGMIWASYGARYSAFNPRPADGERLLVDWPTVLSRPDGTPSRLGLAIDAARSSRLLPEAYLFGLAHSVKFSESRRAFMRGEFSTTGWRSFFPYAFAVKTSLPFLALLALAAAGWWHRRRASPPDGAGSHGWREGLYAASPLLLLVVVYAAFALTTNLNIGHRHLLPIYPPLFILAGGAAYWLRGSRGGAITSGTGRGATGHRRALRHSSPARDRLRQVPAALTVLLVGWHAVESFRIRPHYLAYFNALAGGPGEGYRRLVDSSLDWGQDLPGLKRWLDAQGAGTPGGLSAYLAYFGTSSPAFYGIQAVMLPGYFDRRDSLAPVPLRGGWYCISATMLQGVYLAAAGPWTDTFERQYQALSPPAIQLLGAIEAGDHAQAQDLLSRRGEDYWLRLLEEYDQLRMARLMAYLRLREPVASIGYSILIYRLSDADVAQALFGPAPMPARG